MVGSSPEVERIVAEIYNYVLSAQVRYVKMDMTHPFLEQTFLNVAIFNRSLNRFAESMLMFKRLETLQKETYGEDTPLLLLTWKNLGICCLGTGQSE